MKISMALLPFLCLCLGLLETFTSGLDKICPVGWHRKPGNNCYYISEEPLSFEEAERECKSKNSQLFPVHSKHDQTQLISLLGRKSKNCEKMEICHKLSWIGVRSEFQDWVSVDGRVIEGVNQIWATGYPVDGVGACVFLNVQKAEGKISGHWKNEECSRSLRFVCFSKAQPKNDIPSVDPVSQGKFHEVATSVNKLIKDFEQWKNEIVQEANKQTAEQEKEFIKIDKELKHIKQKVDIELPRELKKIENLLRKSNDSIARVCPEGFDYVSEIDQCLYLNQERHSWNNARDACAERATGAQMLTIKDSAKQKAVKKYLQHKFTRRETEVCVNSRQHSWGKIVWLGGQTEDPAECNSPYAWKSSEEDGTFFTYTNWHSGAPNCYYRGENCVLMATAPKFDYRWEDFVCKAALCSVCEV